MGRHGFLKQLEHDGINWCKFFAFSTSHRLNISFQGSPDEEQPVLLRGMVVQPLGETRVGPLRPLEGDFSSAGARVNKNWMTTLKGMMSPSAGLLATCSLVWNSSGLNDLSIR